MSFPVTPRYFLNFRNSDTGLTPSFLYFKNAVTFANIAPPSIIESPAGGGTYYFDWTWTLSTDPDISFEIDGGVSIPTEEVRYIKGTLSPRDRFLDVPSTQVIFEVKGADNRDLTDIAGTGFATGTDSLKVISDTLDLVKAKTDNLPVDPADESNILAAISTTETNIRGADGRDLTELAGTGFVTGTDSLKVISDNVDAINIETDPTAIANAVWNELISGHQTAGSMGRVLNDVFRILKNKAKINATSKQLEIYDDAGVAIVFVFDLKDEFGVASATRIFQRLP